MAVLPGRDGRDVDRDQRGLRQVMDRSFRLCDDRGRRAQRGLRQVMASPLLETAGSNPGQQGGRGRVVSFGGYAGGRGQTASLRRASTGLTSVLDGRTTKDSVRLRRYLKVRHQQLAASPLITQAGNQMFTFDRDAAASPPAPEGGQVVVRRPLPASLA